MCNHVALVFCKDCGMVYCAQCGDIWATHGENNRTYIIDNHCNNCRMQHDLNHADWQRAQRIAFNFQNAPPLMRGTPPAVGVVQEFRQEPMEPVVLNGTFLPPGMDFFDVQRDLERRIRERELTYNTITRRVEPAVWGAQVHENTPLVVDNIPVGQATGNAVVGIANDVFIVPEG